MDIDQMKYFVEIVRLGSINKAAKALFLKPTSLSYSLKTLEDELGVLLFNRSHSGMVLTVQGEVFYKDVQEILKMHENWTNMAELYGACQPAIVLAAAPIFFNSVLYDCLTKFNTAHTDIYICPQQNFNHIMDSLLMNKEVRFALRSARPSEWENIALFAENIDMEAIKIYQDKYYAFINGCSDANLKEPVGLNELRQLKGVMYASAILAQFDVKKFFAGIETVYLETQAQQIHFIEYNKDYFGIYNGILRYGESCLNNKIKALALEGAAFWADLILICPRESNLTKEEKIFKDYILAYFQALALNEAHVLASL